MKSDFATNLFVTHQFLENDKLYLVAGYSNKNRGTKSVLEPVVGHIAVKLRTPYENSTESKILILGQFTNNDPRQYLFSILSADDYVYLELSKGDFVRIKR